MQHKGCFPSQFSSHLTVPLARQVAALVRSLPVEEQPIIMH